jgi:hypothetical protein
MAFAWFYVPIRPFFDFAPGRSQQAAFFSANLIEFRLSHASAVILMFRISHLPEAVLKSRAIFSRCSCLGDNFLCRLTGLKLDLPPDFAARRERSQFNKNQKTRFDSNFFISRFPPVIFALRKFLSRRGLCKAYSQG